MLVNTKLLRLKSKSSKRIPNSGQRLKLQPRRSNLKVIQKRFYHVDSTLIEIVSLASTVVTTAVVCAWFRYKISDPDQYIIWTGLGIDDMSISKKGFHWPFTKFKMMSMAPRVYDFNLNAMTIEKIAFILPGVFTIGPKNDINELVKYARTVENNDITKIVLGILEGEVRLSSSRMSIEEIFNDRSAFRKTIIDQVQMELDKVGMYIYNANIKELQDTKESTYFDNRSQGVRSRVENIALVDKAEAEKSGQIGLSEAKKQKDIGTKQNDATTRETTSKLEYSAINAENEQKQLTLKSNANLNIVNAEMQQKTEMARIESQYNSQLVETARLRELEIEKQKTKLEALRATELVKTKILAEQVIAEAEGFAAAKRLRTDALLYEQAKKSEGEYLELQSQAKGLKELSTSLGEDNDALLKYLMITRGVYKDMAESSAKAINNLKPDIRVTTWNTPSDKNSNASGTTPGFTDTISGIIKSLPPMFSMINEQMNNGFGANKNQTNSQNDKHSTSHTDEYSQNSNNKHKNLIKFQD